MVSRNSSWSSLSSSSTRLLPSVEGGAYSRSNTDVTSRQGARPCRLVSSTFPCSTPTTTCTRRRTRSPSSCPSSHAGVIDYVQVRGRTKIAVKGRISDYIPNPTFEQVAAPGAQEEYFKVGNPEGKTRREIMGQAIDAPPGLPRAGPAPRADGRARPRPGAHVAHPRQPGRGAPPRRSRRHPRRDPRPQPVDARDVDLQLRGPHLRHPGHHAADRREGDRGARVGHRARRQDHPRPPGSGARASRAPRSFALPEFDPFWELVQEKDVVVGMHASDSGYQRYLNEWEGVRDDEFTPFAGGGAFAAITHAGHRAITDTVASAIGHGMCTRFPRLKIAPVENGSGWVRPLLARHGVGLRLQPAPLRGGPGGGVQAVHLRPPLPRGRPGRACAAPSAPTTCCSAPTTRTPRA